MQTLYNEVLVLEAQLLLNKVRVTHRLIPLLTHNITFTFFTETITLLSFCGQTGLV